MYLLAQPYSLLLLYTSFCFIFKHVHLYFVLSQFAPLFYHVIFPRFLSSVLCETCLFSWKLLFIPIILKFHLGCEYFYSPCGHIVCPFHHLVSWNFLKCISDFPSLFLYLLFLAYVQMLNLLKSSIVFLTLFLLIPILFVVLFNFLQTFHNFIF